MQTGVSCEEQKHKYKTMKKIKNKSKSDLKAETKCQNGSKNK